MTDRHGGAAATRRGRVCRKGRRGAVALEYVLLAALVAIALIGAFRLWGTTLSALLTYVAWDSSAALEVIIQ